MGVPITYAVIRESAEGVLEGARHRLPLTVHGNESRAGVDLFAARHAISSDDFSLGALP